MMHGVLLTSHRVVVGGGGRIDQSVSWFEDLLNLYKASL